VKMFDKYDENYGPGNPDYFRAPWEVDVDPSEYIITDGEGDSDEAPF